MVKHNFINILKVTREVFKTQDKARGFQLFPRDIWNVNDTILFGLYFGINCDNKPLQKLQKCWHTL